MQANVVANLNDAQPVKPSIKPYSDQVNVQEIKPYSYQVKVNFASFTTAKKSLTILD